jgi:hypothetical protein
MLGAVTTGWLKEETTTNPQSIPTSLSTENGTQLLGRAETCFRCLGAEYRLPLQLIVLNFSAPSTLFPRHSVLQVNLNVTVQHRTSAQSGSRLTVLVLVGFRFERGFETLVAPLKGVSDTFVALKRKLTFQLTSSAVNSVWSVFVWFP